MKIKEANAPNYSAVNINTYTKQQLDEKKEKTLKLKPNLMTNCII